MQDEIIHVGNPLPRVTDVVATDDYKLITTWSNGEKRVFDAEVLLDMKFFMPLRNKGFFKLVKAVHGTIEWHNNIDYCPDTLYMESVPLV